LSRNLQLDAEEVTTEAAMETLGYDMENGNEFYSDCLHEYCVAFKEDEREPQRHIPVELQTQLAGRYWA